MENVIEKINYLERPDDILELKATAKIIGKVRVALMKYLGVGGSRQYGEQLDQALSYEVSSKNVQVTVPEIVKEPQSVAEKTNFIAEFEIIKQRHGIEFCNDLNRFKKIYGNDLDLLFRVYEKLLSVDKKSKYLPTNYQFILELSELFGSSFVRFDLAVSIANSVGKGVDINNYKVYFQLSEESFGSVTELFKANLDKSVMEGIGKIYLHQPENLEKHLPIYLRSSFNSKKLIINLYKEFPNAPFLEKLITEKLEDFSQLESRNNERTFELFLATKKSFQKYPEQLLELLNLVTDKNINLLVLVKEFKEINLTEKEQYNLFLDNLTSLSTLTANSLDQLTVFFKNDQESIEDKIKKLQLLAEHIVLDEQIGQILLFLNNQKLTYNQLLVICETLAKLKKSPRRNSIDKLSTLNHDWKALVMGAQILANFDLQFFEDFGKMVSDYIPPSSQIEKYWEMLIRGRDAYLEQLQSAEESVGNSSREDIFNKSVFKAVNPGLSDRDIVEYNQVINTKKYQLKEVLQMVNIGYTPAEIVKLPDWYGASIRTSASYEQKFPVDGNNTAKALWCANNAFSFPKDWQAKRAGNIILQRLEKGIDRDVHAATHWLTHFEVPASLADEASEKMLIKVVAENEKIFRGAPKKTQLLEALFSKKELLDLYQSILAEPDALKRKKLAEKVILDFTSLQKYHQMMANTQMLGELVTKLKDLAENRKDYANDAQMWFASHGMTPHQDLVSAWQYRPSALVDGTADNPKAINTWATFNKIKHLVITLKNSQKLPKFLLENQNDLYEFATELCRVSTPELAVQTLEVLSSKFNKEQNITPLKLDLGEGWHGEIIKRADVRGFTMGFDTGCCMTIQGASESCIWAGYNRPDCAFFVLYRDNQLVAQSFIWVNEKVAPEVLVLDNIEANQGRDRSNILNKYKLFFQKYFQQEKLTPVSKKIKKVHLGTGYVELKLGDLPTAMPIATPGDFYTDSNKQKLLMSVN